MLQSLSFLSTLLKASKRCIYTSGKGASTVGLTAGYIKTVIKKCMLKRGALILADKGLCLIDELDKMNDRDKNSVHEAMAQ